MIHVDFGKSIDCNKLFSAAENLLPAVKPTSRSPETFENMVSHSEN